MEALRKELIEAYESGLNTKCPYCLAVEEPWPDADTRVIFLKGKDAGCRGVIRDDKHSKLPHHIFTVEMDYETKANTLRMVSRGSDKFLNVQRYGVPEWMPPLSIDDNALLHEEMFLDISASNWREKHRAMKMMIIDLVRVCWTRRLPLIGEELLQFVTAHGLAVHDSIGFVEKFDFGMELLIATRGRAPVRKRRMVPMSKGRYLTERHKEFVMYLRGSTGKDDV